MSNEGFDAFLIDSGYEPRATAGHVLTKDELARLRSEYEDELDAKGKAIYEEWVSRDHERRMFAPLWESMDKESRLKWAEVEDDKWS